MAPMLFTYKLTVRGSAVGVEILNTLYYVQDDVYIPDIDLIAGGLAAEWIAQFAPSSGASPWCETLSSIYSFAGVSVMVINTLTGDDVLQAPIELDGGRVGAVSGSANGAAPCAILNMHPFSNEIAAGEYIPRRSYLAYGPLADTQIGDGGGIAGWPTVFGTLRSKLTDSLEFVVTANEISMSPVRWGKAGPTDPLAGTGGYFHVASVGVRQTASFRRSRVV